MKWLLQACLGVVHAQISRGLQVPWKENSRQKPGPHPLQLSVTDGPRSLKQTSFLPWTSVSCSVRWNGGKRLLRALPTPICCDSVGEKVALCVGIPGFPGSERALPSGFSFSCGLAEQRRRPWAWWRADWWLWEWDEIWAFELLKSRNPFLIFSVLIFLKKKKGGGWFHPCLHLRKEQCYHWGGNGLVSSEWLSLRKAWDILV